MTTHPSIEALEARIAPAAIFAFTDVDGDLVTVKTSKGTNADLAAGMSTADAGWISAKPSSPATSGRWTRVVGVSHSRSRKGHRHPGATGVSAAREPLCRPVQVTVATMFFSACARRWISEPSTRGKTLNVLTVRCFPFRSSTPPSRSSSEKAPGVPPHSAMSFLPVTPPAPAASWAVKKYRSSARPVDFLIFDPAMPAPATPFIPPTSNPKPATDVNLVSVYRIAITVDSRDDGKKLLVTIDATKAVLPEGYPFTIEQVIDAATTCVKLMDPPRPLDEGTLDIAIKRPKQKGKKPTAKEQ